MRRAELKQNTHAKLLDALLETVRSSTDSPRVVSVAEAAGLAPGTFYLHFESLGAALRELGSRILDEVGQSIDAHADQAAGLRAYADGGFARREDLCSVWRAGGLGVASKRAAPPSSRLSAWIESRMALGDRPDEQLYYNSHIAAVMLEAALTNELLDDDGHPARLTAALHELLVNPEDGHRATRATATDPIGAALAVGGRSFSFAELDARVAQARGVLIGVGLQKGDALCLLLRNGVAAVELTLAAQALGLTLIPMNTYWRSGEAERVLQQTGARCVAFHEEFRSVLDGVGSAVLRGLSLLPIGSSGSEERYEQMLERAIPDLRTPEPVATTVLYTSGSTDRPKGVLRRESTEERRAHATFLGAVLGVSGEDTVLVTGPLHHAANRMIMSAAIHTGATTVLMDRFSPEAFYGLIDRYGITVALVVPTMLYRLVREPESVSNGYDGSSLRRIVHAGGPCSPDLKRASLERFGPIVYEFFGTTEFGGTFIGPEEWVQHPGSVGRAWDDSTRIRIVDESGADLPEEVVGMVAIGNNRRASFDYVDNGIVRTPDLLADGSFLTGDLGRLDGDGYLYLADRHNAVIKTGGVPVYPTEVEAVIMEDYAVHDCFVVGIPDPEWGESVTAFVQPEPGAHLDVDRLRMALRNRLAHYKCPQQWAVVDSIPRDEGGKLLRSEVSSLINRGRPNGMDLADEPVQSA